MTTPSKISIAIAEPSTIVRSGLEIQLKKLSRYKVYVTQLFNEGKRDWTEAVAYNSHADIYILSPLLASLTPRKVCPALPESSRIVALNYGLLDPSMLREYDGVLPLSANTTQLLEVIERLQEPQAEDENMAGTESQSLTPREREIVVCVVKGMTNREIANALFLSTHTVITHRRNISKKLQIHSPSGLTIYAIMNKLVELDEINQRY
ncbi:response regulator transcription factor [Porphyromonas sp. COT-239 OH1446]|uniref:response regulator transcription factor n=1 Tax=Porphyromonas sp. COT-239 OH1446 TaxID=1515613 RepID=UPI00052D61A8|nr:response regulator transcription factor [Porphyromonas sp. COT-239 OH1446]KGN71361.1 sigma-70 protein [Porphyromonas sp. COT-239 OH1446]